MRKFPKLPVAKGTRDYWIAEVTPGTYIACDGGFVDDALKARRWDGPVAMCHELQKNPHWNGAMARIRVQETVTRYEQRKYLEKGDRVYYPITQRFGVIVARGSGRHASWTVRFDNTTHLERINPEDLRKA